MLAAAMSEKASWLASYLAVKCNRSHATAEEFILSPAIEVLTQILQVKPTRFG